MSESNAAREHARDILTSARTIAVVGFSKDPAKAAHTAPMDLVKRGWDVIPVNPTVDEIDGIATVPDLASIDRHVDVVDVFRPADFTPEIARQAVAIGASGLWLQLGITSGEARSIAEDAGLEFVEDQCTSAIARGFNVHPPNGASSSS